MSNVTNLQHDSHDALFLLDFVSRYAIDFCGSEDRLDVAVMSLFAVLPIFVWISMAILTAVKTELYFVLSRMTITVLTIIEICLLLIFSAHPPVIGCGPNKSFPCPQVALCSYLATSFFCFSRDFGEQSKWTHAVVITASAVVSFSVLSIGFASGPSVLAGSVVGSTVGGTFHQVVTYCSREQPWMLSWLVDFLERVIGYDTTNDILLKQNQAVNKLDPGKVDELQGAATKLFGYNTPHEQSAQVGTSAPVLVDVCQGARHGFCMGFPTVDKPD